MSKTLKSVYSTKMVPTDSDVLVKVEGVGKKFCRDLKKSLWYGVQDLVTELAPGIRNAEQHATLRPQEFWAVDNVSFELRRGECLGLIGRNGAGKTTLLKILNGLIKPDKGRIEMRGQVGALIALGAGFNPILTGRENIYVNASVLGLSKKEIDNKLEEIIDFAEIDEFIDSPVQTYSSGMRVRLGFSVATALAPDVLLLDEVLAVGDAAFRSKCFHRIGKLLDKCAVIFVSHDAVQMSRICDSCLYMKQGEMILLDRTHNVLSVYLKDHAPIRGQQSIILHSAIKSFSCTLSNSSIKWGDFFEVIIKIDLVEKISSGLALLALQDGDVVVAQTDFTAILNSSAQHSHLIRIGLGPMHLRDGEYGLAITILNESKKCSLVHAINCATLQVQGQEGYGVAYQVACSQPKL